MGTRNSPSAVTLCRFALRFLGLRWWCFKHTAPSVSSTASEATTATEATSGTVAQTPIELLEGMLIYSRLSARVTTGVERISGIHPRNRKSLTCIFPICKKSNVYCNKHY